MLNFLQPSSATRLAVVVVFGLMIYGCSSRGIQTSTGEQVTDVMATFESGDARLKCGLACSGAWGTARNQQKSLYDQGLWKDLVILVAKVGFEGDQQYFYLARAAEELGHVEAARTYYKLGLVSFKCAGSFNNCDGLDLPNEIKLGINRLPPPAKIERSIAASESAVSTIHTQVQEPAPIVSEEKQDELIAWFEGAEVEDGYSLVNLAVHYHQLVYTATENTSKYKIIAFSLYILAKNNLPHDYNDWKKPSMDLFNSMTPNEITKAKIFAHMMKVRGFKKTINEYLQE